MRENNIRVPSVIQEAFALGFMVGYTGKIPQAMSDALDWDDPNEPPSYMDERCWYEDLSSHYRNGYEEGCMFHSDHNPQ